jgi:MOSC domain-containing protein YiiM
VQKDLCNNIGTRRPKPIQRACPQPVEADIRPLDGISGSGVKGLGVGRTLRIGPKVVISVLERDPRCKMITIDPDTAQPNPQILRTVNQAHDNKAGVYGAVLVEGTIRRGDIIDLA